MNKLEQIGCWYLRLNGFLTIPNFVVHPDSGSEQRTDIDTIAVRFPHRKENFERPMEDDRDLIGDDNRIRLLLVETKKGQIKFNKTWTDPNKKNIQKVLRATGLFPKCEVEKIAGHIYENGRFQDCSDSVFYLCGLGNKRNETLQQRNAIQITWKQVACFIWERFNEYEKQKRCHPQWDDTGKWLYDIAIETECEQFKKIVCPSEKI